MKSKFKPGDRILCFQVTYNLYRVPPKIGKIYTVNNYHHSGLSGWFVPVEYFWHSYHDIDFIPLTETAEILFSNKKEIKCLEK